MKNKRVEVNKFSLYYAALLIMYFVARVINNDTIYLIICTLGILLIINTLNGFNSYLKKNNYSIIKRIVLVILIPGLIILICYMVF